MDRLDLLTDQFPAIDVPEQVWRELTDGEDRLGGLDELRDRGFLTVTPIDETNLFVELAHELDIGEAAAITHAIQRGADLTLLDEREGRRVARRHGLTVTGVIGILLRAERSGAVDLKAELKTLRECGFWISDELYDEVLANRATDRD